MSKLLIIDGHNMFIRNWAVVPTMDVNGGHTGGVLGSLRSLKSYVRDTRPDRTVVVWDGEGGSVKRRAVYREYKAGRKPRVNREYDFDETVGDSQRGFQRQMDSLRRYIGLLGMSQVVVDDVEADDVIGYLCRHFFSDDEKIVVSSDRDFLQLVDQRTVVYSPSKKKYYASLEVSEEFSCLPENFIYLKALTGDTSDNVKGVKGLGVKTVAKLFPFMSQSPVDLEFILTFCQAHSHERKCYRDVLQAADLVTENVRLMQLTSPVISPSSTRAIRHALDGRPDFLPSELKLSLMRDGIQLTDADFFTVFREHSVISRREATADGQ